LRIDQQRQLRETQVGRAYRHEAAGEPVLPTQPVDRVSAAIDLVAAGFECPAGPERPPSALQHNVITTARADTCGDTCKRCISAIRSAQQQRAHRLPALRRIVIGDQIDTVAHPH
jgi:hypothetical protein